MIDQLNQSTKDEQHAQYHTRKVKEKYYSNFESPGQQDFGNSDEKNTFDNQFGTFNGDKMEGRAKVVLFRVEEIRQLRDKISKIESQAEEHSSSQTRYF